MTRCVTCDFKLAEGWCEECEDYRCRHCGDKCACQAEEMCGLRARVAELEDELNRQSDLLARTVIERNRAEKRVAELEAARGRVGDKDVATGCDCECGHHHEDHDDGCERCMACLIDAALGKEGE